MRFLRVRKAAAQTDVDPRPDPSLVRPVNIVDCPPTNEGSDRQPSRLLLTLEGTAANTCTVSLYAQSEDFNRFENQGDSIKEGDAARRFYEITTGVVLTVGVLTLIDGRSDPVPPGGKIYVRSTTGPAVAAEVLLACAD